MLFPIAWLFVALIQIVFGSIACICSLFYSHFFSSHYINLHVLVLFCMFQINDLLALKHWSVTKRFSFSFSFSQSVTKRFSSKGLIQLIESNPKGSKILAKIRGSFVRLQNFNRFARLQTFPYVHLRKTNVPRLKIIIESNHVPGTENQSCIKQCHRFSRT